MASTGAAPAPISNNTGAVAQPATVAQSAALNRVRVSANWFYWIAGLSLVNSAVVIFGGKFHFVIGLGITGVVDVLAKQAGSAGAVLDLVINGMVAGGLVLLGNFANKAQKWAFLVGMALYAADGLLLLMAGDILSVGFHAYVLYRIYLGLAATNASAQA